MRLTPRRALAAYLLPGACIAGIVVAASLTSPGAALAATSSQCQPLPSTATPSPSASTQAQLCVSVQTSQTLIKSGQAASYTVQVWAVNGSASGVTVTLTGSPAGEAPTFTSRCPSGDGSATCTIGALATPIAPSTFQMSAQIPVAAGTTSVASVTLTATADAATSPAMTALPTAAETVAVNSPTPAATTPAASTAPASAPTPVAAAPSTVPAAVVTPTTTEVANPLPGSASSSLISPAGAASVVPPLPTAQAAVIAPTSAAATSASPSGNFTVVVTAGTAERVLFILIGLVLLFMATRLGRQWLAAGRAQKQGGRAARPRSFRPPWPPLRRRRASSGKASQGGTTEAWAGGSESVAAHSGADQAGGHQS